MRQRSGCIRFGTRNYIQIMAAYKQYTNQCNREGIMAADLNNWVTACVVERMYCD